MGTTQLAIYNRALAALGARRIADLTEQREPRRVLDDLYSDCIQFCLEQGMWNFAMRNAAVDGTASGAFGYAYVYTKPADLVHLFTVANSVTMDPPLTTDFVDQQGLWYGNAATLYVRYTSNDATSGGGNLALWTQSFATYLAHVLAAWAALRVTGAEPTSEAMERKAARYLIPALAIDSVPSLPGLRPFNAEARAKPVEGHQAQPIDMVPFMASAMAPGAAPNQRGG